MATTLTRRRVTSFWANLDVKQSEHLLEQSQQHLLTTRLNFNFFFYAFSSAWKPRNNGMHLTRPKSSKGRCRPAARTPDADATQKQAVPERSLRSQSQPIMRDVGQLSYASAPPPPSLNKYKVLPSIKTQQPQVSAGPSLDKLITKLSLSEDAVLEQRRRHEEARLASTLSRSTQLDPQSAGNGSPTGYLLLAVRAPCGRRFEQHFDPTDTLLKVRASAEVMYGAKYGDATIETMDVPRRTFTDMNMTLAQCGILTRSVLCISQSDGCGA
ncbi:uncharacterized protein V6R79_004088 [Siganus canaliculatus]